MREVVIYREIRDVIQEIIPDFTQIKILPREIEGVTLQWPEAADTQQKRYLVTVICEVIGQDLASRTVFNSKQVRTMEGWQAFVSSVDEEVWWLGDVVTMFSNDSRLAVIFPGSDGAFLHLCTSEELLTRVLSLVYSTFDKINWKVVEE